MSTVAESSETTKTDKVTFMQRWHMLERWQQWAALIVVALALYLLPVLNPPIISTDGASALPKAVAGNVEQLNAVMRSLTGSDLTDMLGLGDEPPHTPEPIVVDGLQDASLARVRAQQLVEAGWTRADIAAELGWGPGNVGKLLCGQTERIRVATATKIRELHAREIGGTR